MNGLLPAVGTKITLEGEVVRRDVTVYGLQRCVIRTGDKYPDLGLWIRMVKRSVWLHYYTEKETRAGFVGFLWLFWKEEG